MLRSSCQSAVAEIRFFNHKQKFRHTYNMESDAAAAVLHIGEVNGGYGVMTRQEVLNNIAYNENLVNQYQREINNLNNRIRTLNADINQYNSRISNYNSKKQTLNRELDELRRLKTKLTGLKDRFTQRQTNRVNNFNKYNTFSKGVNFIASYITGMKDLLSGQEYRNAYNGLTSAEEKVTSKIRAKQEDVNSVQNQINSAQRSIDNTKANINSCRTKINQRNSDLTYRKRRIQYWKEQLQYAT